MTYNLMPLPATNAWMSSLAEVFGYGNPVAPRGQRTLETLQHTMVVDMCYPVVLSPTRKISEKFLGAEAYWILDGDESVEGIAPYNKRIADYSDDGTTFFGAYGPKIAAQLDYVVAKLLEDPMSRQAGLNIWRENPPTTKDVPCTVSMFFNLRDHKLNMHVFMRSSDLWLGVPYDVFNFSMVACQVLCRLNLKSDAFNRPSSPYEPGALHVTAASRHLYERDYEKARLVLNSDPAWMRGETLPKALYTSETSLMRALDAIRNGDEAAKWWVAP